MQPSLSNQVSRGGKIVFLSVGVVAIFFLGACRRSEEAGSDSAVAVEPSHWSSPLRIRATGNEFQWQFTYPGRDGELGTVDDFETGRNLYLPVNAVIELSLTSKDYMYIWSCPDLSPKEIGIPDLVHHVGFKAEPAGEQPILVDPLCGWTLLHGEDMGRVIILPVAEFDEWMASQESPQGAD